MKAPGLWAVYFSKGLRSSKPLVFEKQDDLNLELSRELALLNTYELAHLEEEFSGYEIT